jgi:hypothetical protein
VFGTSQTPGDELRRPARQELSSVRRTELTYRLHQLENLPKQLIRVLDQLHKRAYQPMLRDQLKIALGPFN